MEQNAPRVSVIVPSYNHEQFLEERLVSIFAQSLQDFEVILLDDASTDGSPEILRRYEAHPKVSHLEIRDRNSGSPFHQWRRGVELAKGELIWIAESDDTAEPVFLERMVELIDKGADLAYCRAQKISGRGVAFTDKFWADSLDRRRWLDDFENSGRDEIRDYLCYRSTIPSASACLFRRREGLFPDTVLNSRYSGDWIFWVNYLRTGRIAYTADRLSFHRSHEGTTRNRHDFEGQYGRLLERVTAIRAARNLAGKGWIRPSEVWKYRYMIRMIRRLKRHPEKDRPVLSRAPFELVFYTWLIELRERFQGWRAGASAGTAGSDGARAGAGSYGPGRGQPGDTETRGHEAAVRPLNLLMHTQKTTWEGFTVGGAEISLQLLAEKLAERGHNVFYLTETRRGRLPRYKIRNRNGVEVHALGYPDLPSLGFNPLLRLRRRLAEAMFDRTFERIVRRNCIDVVHTYHELPAMHRILELRKKKGLRYSTVLRMAGLFWVSRVEAEPEISECYEQVFNGVDCLNPNTEGIYTLNREAFDQFGLQVRSDQRIIVQDIGVELSRLPNRWQPERRSHSRPPEHRTPATTGRSEDPKDPSPPAGGSQQSNDHPSKDSLPRYRIVMASRMTERQKRQDLLVEAMALLPPELDTELLLIGDGPQRAGLEETIRRKGLDDRVRLIPFMEQQELWELLSGCDLYTHACDFEGLSKIIIEAMAMGVPVLASEVTPLSDYIHDGENGFLTENSPQQWADQIRRLLERPELRQSVSGPARQTVLNRFDANRNVLYYEELFRQLTS